jgi:hypothetical protein
MKYRSLILHTLCACLFLLGGGHAVAQSLQERMEGVARRLNLGAKRADSERPQPTTSVVSGVRGFYQCFERGCVYYSERTGLHAVSGPIFTEFVQRGAERGSAIPYGRLGFPTEELRECRVTPRSPGGVVLTFTQAFEGDALRIYSDNHATTWEVPHAPEILSVCREILTAAPPRESKISLPSQSGRFRVTLNGFTVNHDTYDHALGYDGQGDEVYILADVAHFNGAGNILSRGSLRTPIMGEVNGQGERIQAGRATDRGGLRTGNQFPSEEPWRRSGEPGERQPPMLLWQGTLKNDGTREGTTAVLIVPTIWERDELPEFVNGYKSNLDTRLPAYVRTLGSSAIGLGNMIDVAPPLGDYAVGTAINLASHDRPIGTSSNAASQWPTRLLWTYDIAEKASASTRDGLGTGIFRVRYQDSEDLGGDYTLYIQIERVP